MLKEFLLYVGFNYFLGGRSHTRFSIPKCYSPLFLYVNTYTDVYASRKRFLVFLLYYGRIVIRLQAMWEREGDGIGKGP